VPIYLIHAKRIRRKVQQGDFQSYYEDIPKLIESTYNRQYFAPNKVICMKYRWLVVRSAHFNRTAVHYNSTLKMKTPSFRAPFPPSMVLTLMFQGFLEAK
jgi:hypothetical protein